MNIYDTRTIHCKNCGNAIGEIEYDAKVILPECGHCTDSIPQGDKIRHMASTMKNQPQKMIVA